MPRLPVRRWLRTARAVGTASTPRWQWLVAVVCAAAGFMFATSAAVSHGTKIRSSDITNLSDLVGAAEQRVEQDTTTVARLQHEVNSATSQLGQQDSAVIGAQSRTKALAEPGGLTALHGPGMSVTLNDAKDLPTDPNVDLNQLVVHQSDLQAVVNALWAGGAEAVTVAGQRIVPTSAVRCVGNTLLLNGRVFSPPFTVTAIGPFDGMRFRLDDSPGVRLYRQAADVYGLGWAVSRESDLEVPAYTGVIALSHAKAAS